MYGTKDKARFERHAYGLLDKYGLAEGDQKELVDYAYEFFNDLAQRFNQIDIISRGVSSGVSDLEKKLEAIAEKLASIESKIPTSSPGSAPEQTKP